MANVNERMVTGTDDRIDVRSSEYRIENDDGTWIGPATAFIHTQHGSVPFDRDTVQLTGEGAYDGLTAHLFIDFTVSPAVVEGAILAGGLTPAPVAPAIG